MPPRYAYWTILIDDKPTAFRAREREELLPTFVQLQRKNTHVTMRWFARGQLWTSREAERDDFQMRKHAAAAPHDRRADRPEGAERRGSDWRPGGTHKDPRDRFKKRNRPERAWSEKDPATQRDRDKLGPPRESRPWRDKPAGPPRGDRPWTGKPPDKSNAPRGFPSRLAVDPRELRRGSPKREAREGGSPARPRERRPWNENPAGGAPPSDRPWQTKPTGPRAQRKPWSSKPAGSSKRLWTSGKPPDKSDVARGFPPRGDRPWQDQPRRRPPGDRPWSNRPPGGAPPGDRKTWQNRPSGGEGKPVRPRTGSPRNGLRKKRDDEPPDRG